MVDPAVNPAARAWAPTAEVVILREHGLPDDFAWWESVDRELERLGVPLYNESINAAVYALYPIPGKGSRAKKASIPALPPPLPSELEAPYVYELPFRFPVRGQGLTAKRLAAAVRTRSGTWVSRFVGEAAAPVVYGVWIEAKAERGQVTGRIAIATK